MESENISWYQNERITLKTRMSEVGEFKGPLLLSRDHIDTGSVRKP